jgi:xanthosine utilization system XapX-like protein
MSGLSLSAWAYVCAVVGFAACLIAGSSLDGLDWPTLAVLALLFLVTDSAPVRLHVSAARISLGFVAILAAVVLLGPAGAALVGFTAVATGQRLSAPVKRLFNGAQLAIAGYLAAVVFGLLGGHRLATTQAGWVDRVIGPFLAASVVFVAVNLTLMAGILLLSKRVLPRDLVREARGSPWALWATGCSGC